MQKYWYYLYWYFLLQSQLFLSHLYTDLILEIRYIKNLIIIL